MSRRTKGRVTRPTGVELYNRLEKEVHDRLVSFLDGKGPILEIGCGDCRHADRLARSLKTRVVGIDISKEKFPVGRGRHCAECIQTDAESVSVVLNEKFAGAVARFVVHELKHPKLVLREVFKVLKGRALVVLADPVKGSTAEQLHNEKYYTVGQMTGFLRWAGFQDVECELLGEGNLAFVLGRKR